MSKITLAQASRLIEGALAKAAELEAAPLTIAVLDPGGHLVAFQRQDNSGIMRPDIAQAKAWGSLGFGASSRVLAGIAQQNPNLVSAFVGVSGGRLVPAPGGVLIRDGGGELVGAVGITGDVSDIDEQCAVAGIAGAGLEADLDPPAYLAKR